MGQLADDPAYGQAPLGVDPGGGLVEEDHLGPAHEGERQRQPLLLAARQPSPRRAGHRAEPDQVEQCVGVLGLGVVAGEQSQDALCPEGRVHPAALEHHAHSGDEGGVIAAWIETEHAHGSRRRGPVALEGLDGGGLARAVRTEQGENLAALGRQ